MGSGFEPAKVLVRGLPLPRPLSHPNSFRVLPVLRPIRGVGTWHLPSTGNCTPATGIYRISADSVSSHMARPLIDWLLIGEMMNGEEGYFLLGNSQLCAPKGHRGSIFPFGGKLHLSYSCDPHGRDYCLLTRTALPVQCVIR